ncbi:hypothetical protein [Rhodoferax sp.]|uniref:hypothetical protein n=1 Tax=Rhodoferax sp. TaxID=50421 RepID=UPI002776C8B5|nr:hypothetical protein [Rhodoferax sp.]
MEPTQANKLAALIVEVFELTGQKLTLDDPVLVAALLQSELIKKAGGDAALMLREAAMEVVAELIKAVKVEREHATSLNRAAADALQKIAEGAKAISSAEQANMATRFEQSAIDTLDRVRKEASKQAPGGMRWRYATLGLAGLALGIAGTVITGQLITSRVGSEQVRLLHNGLLLDAAWAKLPKTARDVIESAKLPEAKPARVGGDLVK